MYKVGIYKTMKVPSPNYIVDLRAILEGIKSGQWKEQVSKYRKTKDSSIKDNLPCYTVGGVFGTTKEIKNLVTPSNILSLDIDEFEGSLDTLMGYLAPIESSLYHVSKSCGDKGYCVLVKIKEFRDYDHFKMIYHAVYSDLEEAGLDKVSKFDYLPNLNRLRFVSYDPNCLTFDEKTLQDYTKELVLPIDVEIKEKGELVKRFVIGSDRLSDSDKFEEVLSKFIEYSGDFGSRGTRHDWILGLARWCCRADISESWLSSQLVSNYHNSARPEVWRKEVLRCVRDSYRAYSAERGNFVVTKKFSYDDILSCSNVEQVKEQVYLLIADKLNYVDYLLREKKPTTFVEKEIKFYKKIVDNL